MLRRLLIAIACLAALAVASERAAAAAPASCVSYAHGVGTLLGIGAAVLRDSRGYAPLIQQAAYAGIDNSASELAAVVKKKDAVDAKISKDSAGTKTLTAKVVAEGRACAGTSASCAALTRAGGQMLGILGSAAGDAGAYPTLIADAAKDGHDNDSKGLEGVANRLEALASQIAQLDNRLVEVEAKIRPLEAACSGQ